MRTVSVVLEHLAFFCIRVYRRIDRHRRFADAGSSDAMLRRGLRSGARAGGNGEHGDQNRSEHGFHVTSLTVTATVGRAPSGRYSSDGCRAVAFRPTRYINRTTIAVP